MTNPENQQERVTKKLKSRWRELFKVFGSSSAVLSVLLSLAGRPATPENPDTHPAKQKNPIVVAADQSIVNETDLGDAELYIFVRDRKEEQAHDTIEYVEDRKREEDEAEAEALAKSMKPQPVATFAYMGEYAEAPEWTAAPVDERIDALLEMAPQVFALDADLLEEFLDIYPWQEEPDEVSEELDLESAFDFPIIVYLANYSSE